jgi:gag-polypeptide of LTR copia-type
MTTKLFTIMIGRMPSPLNACSASTQPSTPTVIELGINIGVVSTYKIESLKDDNWVAWSSRMTTILKFQSAYGHVQGTVPKPNDPAQLQKWEQQDLLAQILIKNNTSDEQMVHINQDSIKTAAQMWQSLRAVHELRGQSGITAAKRTFYGTRASDNVNIPDHIAEMRRQQNKLHQMGCMIDDEEFKTVLVMSLPQSWDHFISSYQGTHLKPDKEGDHSITSQELMSVLIDKYQRHLDSGIVPESWN